MLKQVIRGQKFQIFDMGIFGKLSVRPFGICTLFISKLAWITLKPSLDHLEQVIKGQMLKLMKF